MRSVLAVYIQRAGAPGRAAARLAAEWRLDTIPWRSGRRLQTASKHGISWLDALTDAMRGIPWTPTTATV